MNPQPGNPLPLYLFSGEFHHADTDLHIKGRGLDFAWARRYRSRLGPDSDQGKGWDFSYNIRLESRGDDLMLHDGNGRADVYTRAGDGTFVRDEVFREIVVNRDATLTVRFADTSTWDFHPIDGGPRNGKITRIQDRNGNALTFSYDTLGRLTRVTDTLDRPTLISYNAQGMIEAVTDFTGRRVGYAYYEAGEAGEAGGSFGDLKSVTLPAVQGTPNGNDFPAGKTTTYTYSRGFADERLNHNLLSITDPKGQTYLRSVYADARDPGDPNFDRVTRLAWGAPDDVIDIVYVPLIGRGPAGIKAILNDRVGNVREYTYDERNRLVAERNYTGRADPDRPTTETENRPGARLRPDDPAFFETRYEWTTDSLLRRSTSPEGSVTEHVYELDVNPAAPRRFRGNLLVRRALPGPRGADQAELVSSQRWDPRFGGCCDAFVTEATDPRGNVTRYSYDARGNRVRTEYAIAGVVEDFEYNAFGQMTRMVQPDNGSGHRRADAYEYNTDGPQRGYLKRQVADADSLALATSHEYDAVGNLIRVRDPMGNETEWIHNQLDQVVRETSPRVDARSQVRYRTDTAYDANDNRVRTDVENVDEDGVVRANSHLTTTHEYGILNELIRTSWEVGSVSEGPLPVGAERGVLTIYEYDANRNRTLARSGEAVNGNQPANVVQTLYDESDLPFREIRAPRDPAQSTKQHDYDGDGSLVRLVDGLEDDPKTYRMDHDGFGRLVRTVDPASNVRESSYDANGNLIRTRILGELEDVGGGAQNVRLAEQINVFDEMSRPIKTQRAFFDPATGGSIGDGAADLTIEYTPISSLARQIDDLGRVTRVYYDSMNRPRLAIDERGNSVATTYNATGNPIAETRLERSDTGADRRTATTYGYDGLNRMIREVDGAGNVTRYRYDSRDNTTVMIDALGNVIRLSFDGLDRLVTTTRLLTADGTGGGAAAGMLVSGQTWDDNSRVVTRQDPNGNVARYAYDALDRPASVTEADGGTTSTTYDVHGNALRVRDANGTVVTNAYDAEDRLTHRGIVPGPGVASDTTFERYAWDGLGRLVRAEDDDSLVTRAYDSLSRVMSETLNGRTTACSHDALGNSSACTYPGGRTISATHDSLNLVRTLADAAGPIAAFDYEGRKLERVSYGPSETTATAAGRISYDDAARVVGTRHTTAAAVEIDARTYSWDARGNKIRHTDARSGGAGLSNMYAYDSAYRLRRTSVSRPSATLPAMREYVHDGTGNRIATTGDECSGAYVMSPADSRANAYTATPCDVRRYDANGNLVGASSLDPARPGERIIAYDYRNQMVRHADGTGVTTRYAYDALGRRIVRTVGNPNEATRYFYDGWRVVEEQDGAGATLATYVWGARVDELVSMRRGSRDYYFHADDLGSVRAATDAAGRVLERYEYGDYGKPSFFDASGRAVPASAIGLPYLFTGQRFDPESGLYHYRTRYLDPRSGRFTTRDTTGTWGDAGNLGNAYAYVGNNPATLIDPTGKSQTRTFTCGGGWLTTKKFDVEFIDAGSSWKWMDGPVCFAWHGMKRATARVRQVREQEQSVGLNSLSGWKKATYDRLNAYFGWGDSNGALTTFWTRFFVEGTLRASYKGWQNSEMEVELEDSCDSKAAYVPYGWGANMHLCPQWWQIPTWGQRAGTLTHETTHWTNVTVDYAYIANTMPGGGKSYQLGGTSGDSGYGWNYGDEWDDKEGGFSEHEMRLNADNYAGFVFTGWIWGGEGSAGVTYYVS